MASLSRSCFISTLAAVVVVGTPALSQSVTEHSEHHPPAAASPGASAAASQVRAQKPAPADMSSMMDGMHAEGEGEHSTYREPLYPRLLDLAPTDLAGRRALSAESQHRMMTAAAEIRSASAAASQARSAADREGAIERLKQATAEYQSAAAVAAALRSESHSQPIALDWFRQQMNLSSTVHGSEGRGLLGLSALHILLMTLGGLALAALLALQLARVNRARALIAKTANLPLAREKPATDVGAAEIPAIATKGKSPVRPRPWRGQLRVAHIRFETPTVETYRLVRPDGATLPFDFLPGQFLQVEVEPEPAKRARRSYTIASSPTQRAFVEISVKREEYGAVSKFLNERLKVGDLLKVSGPFGAFTFSGTDAESIVLIAGGVGITPMMSVLRYLTDIAWSGEIFLLYGARSTEEFVFRDEIERLQRQFSNLHVLASMQRAPGTVWMGPEGTLTKDLVASAVPKIADRRIHLCGPPPMMAAVRSLLLELGVPEAQIHSEAFGPASLPSENAPSAVTAATFAGPVDAPPKPAASTKIAQTTVTFSVSGVSAPLGSDESVLEAAEKAGVEIPFQCRVGICGVCVTKLEQGEVAMAVETGLDPADKAQGYVLACQAKSTGEPLVVEA